MNIEKELLKIIKKIDGKVLFIGYDDNKINKAILNNDNITMCDIFSVHKSTKKNKGEFDGKASREIVLRKINKEYKKKYLDYVFCDIEVVKKEINYFIKNSLYLSSNKIYLYGSTDDYSVNTIKERYEKYNLDINVNKKDRQYIIEITNKNKYNSLKSNTYLYLYNTVDFINKLIDSTGDVMTR